MKPVILKIVMLNVQLEFIINIIKKIVILGLKKIMIVSMFNYIDNPTIIPSYFFIEKEIRL